MQVNTLLHGHRGNRPKTSDTTCSPSLNKLIFTTVTLFKTFTDGEGDINYHDTVINIQAMYRYDNNRNHVAHMYTLCHDLSQTRHKIRE